MAIEPKNKPADLDTDVNRLKSDFADLSKDVKALMSSIGSVASSQGKKGVRVSKEYADDAVDSVQEARGTVESKIRENPLPAVGIAFGLGVLLTALRSR